MYVLITANRNYSSWSLRPWVLMRALGLSFEDRIEPFAKPVNYEAFRGFSPTGQVPALLHEGRTIYDSLGIALYLADRHAGVWPAEDNPLHNAPHTAEDVVSDEWSHPYSRTLAAYPVPGLRRAKYWPPVSRIDGAFGDRNLVCSCPPVEAFAEA